MGFQGVLKRPAQLLWHEPKAILPAVLSLLPSTLFLLLATLFAQANPDFFTSGALDALQADPAGFFSSFFSAALPFMLPLLAVAVISVAIALLLSLWYAKLMEQGNSGGKIELSKTFEDTRGVFWKYAKAWLIGAGIILLAFLAWGLLVAAAIGALGVISSSAGNTAALIVGVVLGLVLGVAIIAGGLLAAFTFWLLPAVCAFSGQEGTGALGESLSHSRQKFLPLLLTGIVLAVAGFAFGQAANALGAITYAGALLGNLLLLPYSAWSLLLPASFYLEHFGKGRK